MIWNEFLQLELADRQIQRPDRGSVIRGKISGVSKSGAVTVVINCAWIQRYHGRIRGWQKLPKTGMIFNIWLDLVPQVLDGLYAGNLLDCRETVVLTKADHIAYPPKQPNYPANFSF